MTITPPVFEAYLKCTTKCWRLAVSENPTGNAYAEWIQDQNESYLADGLERLLSAVPQHECAIASAAGEMKTSKWRLAVDVPVRTEEFPLLEPRGSRRQEALTERSDIGKRRADVEIKLATSAATTNGDKPQPKCTIESRLHAVERVPSEGRGKPAQFVPVRFVFTNKLGKDDRLLLAFDALALSRLLGREVRLGKIIHGDKHFTLKMKTSGLADKVRKRLEKIAALLSNPAPPDLVLNRHCVECEFQTRCRQKALERDDLSLLSGMSPKERQKLRSKGIFTVTQLSYTFRPRRRPKRQRDKREKYHPSLNALAIREGKIHIVGHSELKIEGTPVYVDVEGLPDRDFYYLIGVRIGSSESAVQHSLWADTVEDEGKIWWEFLGILDSIEKPVLIHYGGFESTFMRHMRQKYGEPPQDSVGHRAIKSSTNLVSVIFAQFYFPTYSNGLKDVARILGFQWSDPMASGTRSVVMRSGWEQSHEPTAKEWLVRYNANDCEALDIVASSLLRTCGHPQMNESNVSDMVNVESLKPQMPFSFGKKESVTPDLEFLRKAAYWDYQRDRLYFRPSGRKPKSRHALAGCNTTSMRINQVVVHDVPPECPTCKRTSTKPKATRVRILYDLWFGHFSIKRWVVKHVYQTYFCSRCERFFGLEKRFRQPLKFGWNLVACFVYQTIQLCIPQRIVTLSMNNLGESTDRMKRLASFVGGSLRSTVEGALEAHGRRPAMDYGAIDLHKTASQVRIITESGEVIGRNLSPPARARSRSHERLSDMPSARSSAGS